MSTCSGSARRTWARAFLRVTWHHQLSPLKCMPRLSRLCVSVRGLSPALPFPQLQHYCLQPGTKVAPQAFTLCDSLEFMLPIGGNSDEDIRNGHALRPDVIDERMITAGTGIGERNP